MLNIFLNVSLRYVLKYLNPAFFISKRSQIWCRPRERLAFVSPLRLPSPWHIPVRRIHLVLNANQNAGDSALSWWSLCLFLWIDMWVCALTCLHVSTKFLPCIVPLSTFHQVHLTTHKHPQVHLPTHSLITGLIFVSVPETVKHWQMKC